MPYVKKEQRKQLDVLVKSALKIYKDSGRLYWDYILVKLAERFLTTSYNKYKNFLAEITESAFEMERRFGKNSSDGGSRYGFMGSIFIPNDHAFEELNTFVLKLRGLRIDGDLNYVLFAFGKRMEEIGIVGYVIQLRQTVDFIRKQMLAPYEDEKIKENGDVK